MPAGPDPAFAPQTAAGVALEHDEIRLSRNDIGGGLPLPLGEGWGEGLRSLVRAEALTRFAAQIDLSPPGRGEPTSRQVESIKSHTGLGVTLQANIFAGILAGGRHGQPAEVMRPTLGVVGTLLGVWKTAMGHAQQGAEIGRAHV